MTSKQRIEAFSALGTQLKKLDGPLLQSVQQAVRQNPWFTEENTRKAVLAHAENLNEEALSRWLSPYRDAFDTPRGKTIGLVLAGNIPMVGFHDVLSCLIAGFSVQIKLSSDDRVLLPYVFSLLNGIAPALSEKIQLVERLSAYDAVIATGSNNSSRYFEQYFKGVPHIIRRNRNGVAVLSGAESPEELNGLGHDIFDYFGLGCRNVSKLYIPAGYDKRTFFEGIASFHSIADHFKYHNNYEFNKSIYLVNGEDHLDNGFLLLKPDAALASPLAVVYYEEYEDLDRLTQELQARSEEIQCVVSALQLKADLPVVAFGKSQSPGLSDYADRVNVLDFLAELQI